MNKVVFSKNSDEWETPEDFFEKLNNEFHFTVDVCASDDKHKCDKYYTIYNSSLNYSWDNEIVFCNPPYSNIRPFIEKALKDKCLSVFLVPARTDTKWFHELIYNRFAIRFIKGRLKFSNKGSAPFPSMLCIFDNRGDYDFSMGGVIV